MFRLVPVGGLGNRLRAMLSCLDVHGEVEVLWANSPAVCGARFLDVFEPVEGLTFRYVGDGHAHEVTEPHEMMSCGINPHAGESWTRRYAGLRPRAGIREIVTRLWRPQYRAVHARRTDHVELARRFGHFTDDRELEAWAMQGEARVPIYVATDSPSTLSHFMSHVSGVFWHRVPEHVEGYEVRPGTLADAVVNLYVCAGATAFRGSWFSSFSETVEVLRCGGVFPGGFDPHVHMPSQDESYRVK